MSNTISASCFCGALAVECDLPSLWAGHCHCSQCQRYHGAAFVTWVGFDADGFNVTGDADALTWFQSSANGERGFCNRCGTSMLFRSSQWPGEVHVCLANLQEELDREPAGHVFTDTQVHWVTLGDNLPRKTSDQIG